MNARTALKVLGGAALGAFVIACARVDVFKEREEELRRYYAKHPRWTDANRWE